MDADQFGALQKMLGQHFTKTQSQIERIARAMEAIAKKMDSGYAPATQPEAELDPEESR